MIHRIFLYLILKTDVCRSQPVDGLTYVNSMKRT